MKYASHCLFKIILCFICFSFVPGCSSTPKGDESDKSFDIRNRASENAKHGDNYFNLAQYAQALKFFELSLKDNISVNNEAGMVKTYNSIGKVYLAQGLYDLAANNFNKAYTLAKKISDSILLSQSENNLGEVYLRLGNPQEALILFESSIKKIEDYNFSQPDNSTRNDGVIEVKDHRPILYHNAGMAYKQLNDLIKSIELLNKALTMNTEKLDYKGMAELLWIGFCLFQTRTIQRGNGFRLSCIGK